MDKQSEHAKQWIEKARSDLLNPYSVEVRYPDDAWMPTLDDATEARQAAQEVLNWMQSRFERLFL